MRIKSAKKASANTNDIQSKGLPASNFPCYRGTTSFLSVLVCVLITVLAFVQILSQDISFNSSDRLIFLQKTTRVIAPSKYQAYELPSYENITSVINESDQKTTEKSGKLSQYEDTIRATNVQLTQHPLHFHNSSSKLSLDEVIVLIASSKDCSAKPVFISMGNVFSDLYWQMIENFVYTLAKFNHVSCSLMICVTDQRCMDRCRLSKFPCFDYNFSQNNPVRGSSSERRFPRANTFIRRRRYHLRLNRSRKSSF